MNVPIAPNPECKYCGGIGIIEEHHEIEARNGYGDSSYTTHKKCSCIECEDKVIIGYMDKNDFDCEVGDNPNGNIFFTSIEDLKREMTCSEFCGIVEIEIRLKRVVKEPKDE